MNAKSDNGIISYYRIGPYRVTIERDGSVRRGYGWRIDLEAEIIKGKGEDGGEEFPETPQDYCYGIFGLEDCRVDALAAARRLFDLDVRREIEKLEVFV